MIIKIAVILQILFAFNIRYGLKNYEINDIILLELTLAEGVYDISRNGNERIKRVLNDTGTVIGVENLDDIQKRIADIITTQILPNPQEYVTLGTQYVDGKNVVVVSVRKGKKNTEEARRDVLFA